MGLVSWIKYHWKSALVFLISTVIAAIISKAIDQDFDLGLFGKLWEWLTLPMPLSLPPVVPIAFLLAISLLGLKCYQLKAQLATLKNPASTGLDSLQERVLFWILKIYDSKSTGVGPTPAEVAKASEIPLSEVEAVLDVLKQCEIVRLKKYKGDPIDLTPRGRTYIAQADKKSRYHLFCIKP